MRPLVIFGTGESAELAHFYFTRDAKREVAAFTVDGEYLKRDRFCGLPVAFKLGTALGALLLPPLTWLAFRAMRFRFPTPLLGAAAAGVFLLMEENPIWGGTLASLLTGEFAYSYGAALGVAGLLVTLAITTVYFLVQRRRDAEA